MPDNGQPYAVANFRMMSSNILADDYLAVEGLVVDMKKEELASATTARRRGLHMEVPGRRIFSSLSPNLNASTRI